LAESKKRLSVIRTDAGKRLPIPDASVDIVVGTRVFSHLSSKDKLFQINEIVRILRPGGNAFLTMLYFFGLGDIFSAHPDNSDSSKRINGLETSSDIISMLEKMNCLGPDADPNLALFPGSEDFSEERVQKLPGLIICSPDDLKDLTYQADIYEKGLRCAEIGMVLEKPIFHQPDSRMALGHHNQNENSGSPKHYDLDQSFDDRTSCLLSVFPSIVGKRFLCLYDDGSDFTGILEKAGARFDSCVPDMDAYHNLKIRYPERECWVHDLNFPWSLNLSERYDAVLAFNVLDRLSNPIPFLEYVTQLGPVLFIDMPCNFENSEAKSMVDPIFLKDQMQRFDVVAHQFPKAIDYEYSLGTGAKKSGGQTSGMSNEKRPRHLFICRRQRDNLEPMIVHVHIPKAAGQAFEDFLSQNFAGRVKLYYPEQPAAAQWDLFKKEIQNESSPLVFSSQSMNMYFPAVLGNRIMLYVSLFRHPYSMVFSYVKYIKKNYEKLSTAHQAILPENLRSMSIEESVKWHIRNGGFFPLPVLELTKGLGVKRAKDIVDRFFFTGIVEEMDRSIKLLSIKLKPYGFHLENLTMPRKNTTRDVDLEGYDFHADQEFQEFAGKELHEEVEFYEWVRERFAKDAELHGV
jgi:hypothetical protein